MNHIRINGKGYLGSAIASKLAVAIKDAESNWSYELKSQLDPYEKYPDVIIHTSWQTNVDKCSTEASSKFICFEGLENAFRISRKYGSRIIFISSSYVFDGEKTPADGYESYSARDWWNYAYGTSKPLDIFNRLHPTSAYGRMKLEAENRLLFEERPANSRMPSPLTSVVRTDALYGEFRRYRYDKGATDQISNPTYIPYLADVVSKMALAFIDTDKTIARKIISKQIYHVVGPEVMSRFDFIKNFSHKRVKPCLMEDLGLPAGRPKNSALKNDDELLEMLGVENVSVDKAKEILNDRLFT